MTPLVPPMAPTRARFCPEQGRLAATLWFARWRERMRLLTLAETLPDALLADALIRRDDLRQEARKPFWRG